MLNEHKSQNKSIKLNMIINAVRGLMSIVFPLISFPYVTKTLGVDNIGKYTFANSIISYFALLAGLGINAYAVREGSRIKNKPEQFSELVNEIFTINVISTAVSYLLLLFTLAIVPKFSECKYLIVILSLQIAFKTLGIDWIYAIYEEFVYITIRSIVFQCLSIILLFSFVRNSRDLYVYAFVTVLSAAGSNIFNFVHSRKYLRIKLTKKIRLGTHIKPIGVLFATALTVTIYVSSDVTMLGLICGDYTVGIYSVSVKIYGIVKTLLSSILVVSIPRLSSFLGEGSAKEFNYVASDVFSTLISVVMPTLVGIIFLRKEIVLLVSGKDFIEATNSLMVLALALFACLGAWFWSQCVLIPFKCDKDVFVATVISALVNVFLNFILIPLYKENAAALTTLIAEGTTFVWCWWKGRRLAELTGIISTFLKTVMGCAFIAIVHFTINHFAFESGLKFALTTFFSFIFYIIVECIVKNNSIVVLVQSVKKLGNKISNQAVTKK